MSTSRFNSTLPLVANLTISAGRASIVQCAHGKYHTTIGSS